MPRRGSRRVNRLAVLAALVLFLPVAVAAEPPAGGAHPVLVREARWIEEARALHDRVAAARAETPSEFEAAWSAVSRPNATENVLGLAGSVAYFRSVAAYVEARAGVPIDYRSDGREGCRGNSSCARFLALADAAANATAPRHADAVARARSAWSDLERARGLETAVAAQAALDDAAATLASYPAARARLTSLRSYDPSAPAYEHLLIAAWAAAQAPGEMLPLAADLVLAAGEADETGPRLDPGRLAAAVADTAAGLPVAANASAPEVGAAYLAQRTAREYDRLVFTSGDTDSNAQLRQALATEIDRAAPAVAAARALGYDGLLLEDALATGRREAAGTSGSDAVLARATAEILAASGLHARLLHPSVVAEAPPGATAEGGSGAVVAAVATAGALALVGGAALLLRRKP